MINNIEKKIENNNQIYSAFVNSRTPFPNLIINCNEYALDKNNPGNNNKYFKILYTNIIMRIIEYILIIIALTYYADYYIILFIMIITDNNYINFTNTNITIAISVIYY
jgi:hypothetical protein